MASRAAAKPLLEVKALSKHFGGVMAVDQLDLNIARSEMLCLIGPNGCGKTTLFNLISGEIKADAGAVIFNGHELAGKSPAQIAQSGIVRKFQVPSIFKHLTVRENIAVAGHVPNKRAHLKKTEIAQLLAETGLDDLADHDAAHLSHGQKQWLEIAMVLATTPSLLLLDEPTAGMTRAETGKTAQLLKNIHGQRQLAMIVIEHDMGFVEKLATRVAAMVAGKIIVDGNYEDVARHPAVKEVYLGNHAA